MKSKEFSKLRLAKAEHGTFH